MELKPCPFCGKIPSFIRWGNNWDVECMSNDCLIIPETPLFKTKIEAAEAWNRRVETKGVQNMNNENFTTDTIEKDNQTRGDRIRSMTDEELAWELMEWRFDARAKAEGGESGLPDTQKTICEWLKQTVV